LARLGSDISRLRLNCFTAKLLRLRLRLTGLPSLENRLQAYTLGPVHTGDKVERTFDILASKITRFRQSRPSCRCSTLATVSTATSCRIRLCGQFNVRTSVEVESRQSQIRFYSGTAVSNSTLCMALSLWNQFLMASLRCYWF